ncbi:MAG: hypothetical protein PGN13_08090 [Patulibacter minatonensis]
MHEHDEDDAPGFRLGLPTILVLGALLVGSLVAGLVVWGTGGEAPPTVGAASGCTVTPLKYTVTNDPAVFAEQKRFESTINAVPKPGFYDRVLDPIPTLHAASHSFVVVFAREGLGGAGIDGLQAMERAAVATKAPVVVSRRRQDAAFVALSRGYELSCAEGGAVQAAEVRRFAAQEYASVADPADAGTSPAPSTPNDAPSPADQ